MFLDDAVDYGGVARWLKRPSLAGGLFLING